MNVAGAGPLVAIWLKRRARRGDVVADAVGNRLAWLSFAALGWGIVLGALSLALIWKFEGHGYFAGAARIPAFKYYFAAAELACSLVWTGLYAWGWQRMSRWPKLHALLALLSGTNLLYHFPPLLAAISVLGARHDGVEQTLDLAAYRALAWESEVLSRVVHVWLASFAVCGVTVMALAVRAGAGAAESAAVGAIRIVAGGARLALVPTLLQIPVGLWTLMALSETPREALLGSDWLGSALFVGSILASFALLHALAALALGDVTAKGVHRSVGLMLLIVIAMSGTLRRSHSLATPAAPEILSKGTAWLPRS